MLAGGLLAQPLASAMAQSAASRASSLSAGARLRKLIEPGEPVQCPVIHDVISAKLAVAHGFPLVLAGGGAISQDQFGMGDYGMLTITEMIDLTSRIVDCVEVPDSDGDDGGGNPLNVIRAVRMLERAGAACVLIEDLFGAKHLGSLGNGNVLATEAMVDKIHAATDARRESGFAILARCDAPKEQAYDLWPRTPGRRRHYHGRCGSSRGRTRIVELTKKPLLSTHMAPVPEQKKNRVSIAVYSGPLLNAAVAAMDRVLTEIKTTGLAGSAATVDRELLGRVTDRDASVAAAKKYNALRR